MSETIAGNVQRISNEVATQEQLIAQITSNLSGKVAVASTGAGGGNVPAGGEINQILAKNSVIDYDTKWVDMPADGADGVDGDSAYEIAVANGFSGSEEEWLASLKGKAGLFAMEVEQDGHLYVIYDDATPQPPLSIENGHLIYTVNGETSQVVDLGNVRSAIAYNLLDNSDFRKPVNQRGRTSYTSGAEYTIDRWRTWADGSMYINDGYITVDSVGSFCQYVPNTCGTQDTKTYSAFGCKTDGSIVALELFWGSNNDSNLAVVVPAGDWVWAACYEGAFTIETCPPYIPKGYAVELAECKRYYQEVELRSIAHGVSTLYFTANFQEKRAYPSVVALTFDQTGNVNNTPEIWQYSTTSCVGLVGSTIDASAQAYAYGVIKLSADL